MKSDWFVSPAALARARLHQLLSQEQLADKSGLSLRSIQGYERQEQRVRIESLQCLAKVLAVEVREIANVRTAPLGEEGRTGKAAASGGNGRAYKGSAPPARESSVPPPAKPPSVLPPRTPLETLVDLERAAGIAPAPVETPHGAFESLTAKRLQDVFTAYAVHDGSRFALLGRVGAMRGIPPAEAALIGGSKGIAARFHVVKEIVPGQPLGVTVHTGRKEHTAKLQESYEKLVTLVVRVVLAPEGAGGGGFSSFISRLAMNRPWTFVVEEIVG